MIQEKFSVIISTKKQLLRSKHDKNEITKCKTTLKDVKKKHRRINGMTYCAFGKGDLTA